MVTLQFGHSLIRAWQGRMLLCAALLAGAPGCGGASYDGRVFRSGEIVFQTGPVPDSWRRVEVDDALLAFRDDRASATIAVNGRCGQDGDDIPLPALTQHLFLHFSQREIVSEQLVPLDGREALRTELVANLDGVPNRFLVFVLKKDGCVYDFVLISGTARSAEQSAGFEQFVRGFQTVG